jgi:hypothetical protein
MATLALTNTELYAEIGQVLGISRDRDDWDAATTQADVDRMIRSGRRRFFSAYNWKFLKDNLVINTTAPVSTGTVTIVDGVVTFAGAAAFPSNFADYVFAPDGGGVYAIASRTSDTEIILEDLTVDADALSEYTIYQTAYDLPAAFGGWQGPITIENYEGRTLNESRNFPEYVVRQFENRKTLRTDIPSLFSVRSTPDAETAIATHQLVLYPLPDAVYVLKARYKISAGDTLDADAVDISADPVFSECYKESVLAAAEVIAYGKPGAHSARFKELLIEAVRQDNAMAGIRHGRPRRGARRLPKNYQLIIGEVDMSGQEP